jgi:DNA repair protein RecO (recombination protein O)
MIIKTDAIVLKSMRYRDTSKIVTFYSRRFGKIKGIAKGARDTRSKFGASLEPLTIASVVLYKKEHREIQLISQCDIVRRFKRITADIDRMAVALSVLELVNQVTHDEEDNPPLYALIVDVLEAIEQAEHNVENLLYAFEIRLASLFGYAMVCKTCLCCRRSIKFGLSADPFRFDVGKGGLWCQQCAATSRRGSGISGSLILISAQAAKMLEWLSLAPLESVQKLNVNEAVGNEIDEVLRLYLRYHFEGIRSFKSRDVFQKISM